MSSVFYENVQCTYCTMYNMCNIVQYVQCTSMTPKDISNYPVLNPLEKLYCSD